MKATMKTGAAITVAVFIKSAVMVLLLSAWFSCGQKEEPELGDKPYATVKIENLQTQLCIVDTAENADLKELWRSGAKDVIISYQPSEQHSGTYFGYAEKGGNVLLCEAIDFPESAKQWKGATVRSATLGTYTEINVKMEGTVHLYVNEKGEKYGTIELTFLEAAPEESGEKPYLTVKIENLQTRLRIVEPKAVSDRDVMDVWRPDPRDIIVNYPPYHSHEDYTCFGYADTDGKILLCEVLNLPDSARKWKEQTRIPTSLGTITEINVKMNGTVRLYTDDKGEKYGTLELTSLKTTGVESSKPVLRGVYAETYPHPGCTRIDFIDGENLILYRDACFEKNYPTTHKYEINEQEHVLTFYTETSGVTAGAKLYINVLNNSKFEMEYLYATTAEKCGWIIMTFEKVSN